MGEKNKNRSSLHLLPHEIECKHVHNDCCRTQRCCRGIRDDAREHSHPRPHAVGAALPAVRGSNVPWHNLAIHDRTKNKKKDRVLRALPALEKLHGMEEDREGLQIYAGIVGVENGAVCLRTPSAAGACGDPKGMRRC